MTSEGETAFPERPADPNQAGQTSTHHRGAHSHGCAEEDRREVRLETHSWEHRQQLEFQDSSLSPGLPLLLTNHEGERRFTEYSLFQQSGNEFVPLRPDPDISTAPPHPTTEDCEHGLLSDYPLMETTLLSEGELSCSSLSQHSFSPLNEGRPTTAGRPSLTADRKEPPPSDDTEPATAPQDHPPEGEAAEECVASGTINLPVSAEPTSSQTRKRAGTPPERPCQASPSQNQLSGSGQPSDADGALGTGPLSGGLEGGLSQHPGSLGNQTDIDGSYLGVLPQSQSTPGVFKAPPMSSVKAKAQRLSAIQSSKDDSSQSDAGISPRSCDHRSEEATPSQEDAAPAGIPSLPSVSYTQKVDAWRANQRSARPSLLEGLALQGGPGSQEKDANTPNGLPSQTLGSQQPHVSVPAKQSAAGGSSVVPPGSAETALSRLPAEDGTTGRSRGPSALLSTASQSSSLSTVMPGRTAQGTRGRAENEGGAAAGTVRRGPRASAQPPVVLVRSSDASADHDLTLSASQDSSGSGLKLAASFGTSSVVSLEIDNYAPYWTSKVSTPPPQQRSRELNIEERIPLYLQNLGIDQSPSTILTPFVPRGPIREPEFSPTDFCTIKGSIGTPTRSVLASEEENIVLELRESSFSSSSPPVGPGTQSSRLWARSSSDSLLRSELRGNPADPERTMSPQTSNGPSATTSRNSTVHEGAGPSFVPSQSARRTEPEGCSAAPPDSTVPPQPGTSTSSASGPQQLAGPAEETQTAAESPGQDTASAPLSEDNDQGATSVGSSGGSLAVKVTALLQSDPPTTVVSSTSSMADQEQRKAREWSQLKVSGHVCESLELHEEDRRQIDEFKKELLLTNGFPSEESTETESSEAEPLAAIGGAVSRRTQGQQSRPDLQNLPRPDLEAQIQEIVVREGVTLTRTDPRSFTSITIASRRRSSSSSSSPPPPEPLHLSELSTDATAERPPPAAVLEAVVLYEPSSQLHQGVPGIQPTLHAVGGHMEDALLPPEDALLQSLPPSTPGHVSHVHLTLSPKSSGPGRTPRTPREPVPARPGSAASDADEGLGPAGPPGWSRDTEPMRQREDVPTLDRSRDRLASQDFTASPGAVESARAQTTEAAAPPPLWPYRPKGSEDVFYVLQREADRTSSDTTMESSHPGSNDAVPPRFSSDVLGHGAPGISRGVTLRHSEGIYSRRAEASTYLMHQPEHRESTTHTRGSRPPQPSSPAPVTRATALRDWGTSPGRLPGYHPSELSQEEDYESHDVVPSVVPPLGRQDRPPPPSSALRDSGPALDQLWQHFCARWNLEEPQPARDGEASLLDRLERLSRLIHGAGGREGAKPGPEEEEEEEEEAQRRDGGMEKDWWRRDRDGTRTPAEAHPWRLEEPSEPAHGPPGGPHRPADGGERDTLSTSGSASTVDTARLVRAFGSHRVHLLKDSSRLRRLYSSIDQQRGGRTQDLSSIRTSEDSAVSAESASSSTPTPTSHHGPSRTLRTAVRVANKGVQAGDLELVCSGTRRHTRDVGTTFPSPAESRLMSSSSSSLEGGGGGGWGHPSKTQRRRRSKKSPSKVPPAEELGAEGRKENLHEEEEAWRPGTSWFEPYSRIQAWREPLRPRQAPEDGNNPSSVRQREPGLGTKPASAAAAGWSLQEALVMRRPDFISESRQRLRRLAQQVEARKLQEVLGRRREERLGRPGGAARQLHPPGNMRRAVPRKEMIQRSKQIYNNLPEVRKRREEERRREQYDSYRLKAQLYNKRITSRVLARRTAWQ